MANQPTEPPERAAFVAALNDFDVARLKTLIDAGTMSLADLIDFKDKTQELLAFWERSMDRGMSFHEVLFYIHHIVPKQRRVIALLESEIGAQLEP